MFGKSLKFTAVKAADNTYTATVEERTTLQGLGDFATSLVDDNVAVSGLGRTVGVAGLAYLSAVGTNRVLTGSWNVNPLRIGRG